MLLVITFGSLPNAIIKDIGWTSSLSTIYGEWIKGEERKMIFEEEEGGGGDPRIPSFCDSAVNA